jgi:hypothetical protein
LRDSLTTALRKDTANFFLIYQRVKANRALGDTLAMMDDCKRLAHITLPENHYQLEAAEKVGEYYLRQGRVSESNTYYDIGFQRDATLGIEMLDTLTRQLVYRGIKKKY